MNPLPPPPYEYPELVRKVAFRRGCVTGLFCGLLAGMSLAAWLQATLAGAEWYRQKEKPPAGGKESEAQKPSGKQ